MQARDIFRFVASKEATKLFVFKAAIEFVARLANRKKFGQRKLHFLHENWGGLDEQSASLQKKCIFINFLKLSARQRMFFGTVSWLAPVFTAKHSNRFAHIAAGPAARAERRLQQQG